MKTMRTLTFIGGLVILVLAFGFIFRVPLALSMWPWEDGRYSYLFVGSIFAAVSAAMLWVGWTGDFGVLPAGSLNVFVIAAGTCIYFFKLALQDGRMELIPFAIVELAFAIFTGVTFLRSRTFPLAESRPTPALVKFSFAFFTISLIITGTMLIFHMPIFPWDLNPDSSVIFGCIFIGDAFYFLYGFLYPRWNNAVGQLLSFLVYDLVLIIPFLFLLNTVKPDHFFGLVVYVVILIYSGALAAYYLFINSQTRFGSRT
ncbi:MAG: hypothetical protein H7Y59_05935 [Anaerolineales bacterium]|nr:hypothetical protein [Anaerolineales bacterium]